ncbi:MAG: hypothetical protein GEU90_14285 [Gemmatimonas sp.]|nr:hypothetical protein [Gemmatimonas sp.]
MFGDVRRWARRWRRRVHGILRRETVEREMADELAHHLEMEVRKNLDAGMTVDEARRQARLAFGGVERVKEEVRENRWLGRLSGVTLDVKLGGRMLRKYPWLTIVGGLGLAVVIGAGTLLGTFLSIVDSTAPLPEGDRLVAIENWDLEINNKERQILHDFLAWRDGLQSVQDVGAYADARRTIRASDLSPTTALFAEMSAVGFRVASTPPLLGRTLLEEDELQGAPNVVVLGYDVWERAFGADSTIIGREVSVGAEIHTVVGVMPDGFAFPMFHEAWTPLRLRPSIFEPRTGPDLYVFGRLVPGATPREGAGGVDDARPARGRRAPGHT